MTVPTSGTKNETRVTPQSKLQSAFCSAPFSAARLTPLQAEDASREGARSTSTHRSTLLPAFDIRNLPVNTGTRSMDPPPCYNTSLPFASFVRVTESPTKLKSPAEKPSSSSTTGAQVIAQIVEEVRSHSTPGLSTRPLTASESMMSVTENDVPGPSARTVDSSMTFEPFIRASQFTEPAPQAQMSPDIEMKVEAKEARITGPSTSWASFTQPYIATPIQVTPSSATVPAQAPLTPAWKPFTEAFREGNSAPAPVFLPQQTRYTPYEMPRLQQTAFLSQWANGVDEVSARYQSTAYAQRALKKKTTDEWPSLMSMLDRMSPEEFAAAEIRRLRLAKKSPGLDVSLAVLSGAHLKVAPARSNGLSRSIFVGPSAFSPPCALPLTNPDAGEPGVLPTTSLGDAPSDTPDVSPSADILHDNGEYTISIIREPRPSREEENEINKNLLYVTSPKRGSKRKRESDGSSSSLSRSQEAAGSPDRRKRPKIVAASESSFSDTDMEEILREDWKKKMLRQRDEQRLKDRLRARIEKERKQRQSMPAQAPATHNHFAQGPQPQIIPGLHVIHSYHRTIQQPSAFERAKKKLKLLVGRWT